MRPIEAWVLSYLLNSVWQAPLFCGAGWAVSYALRGRRVTAIHRVWVATLLLEAGFPALAAVRWPFRGLWLPGAQPLPGDGAGVTVTFGNAAVPAGWGLSSSAAAVVSLTYCAWLLWLLGRLLWRWRGTVALGRNALPLPVAGEAALLWDRARARFGREGASLLVSDAVRTPITLGVVCQHVILPPGLLAKLRSEDLQTLLAHECAHMRRNDFALNLLYEFVALPVAYHPFLRLTRYRLTESREWVCDAEAAEATGSRPGYARSLLRLATFLLEGAPAKPHHAIGMLDANALQRRVMKMTHGTKVEGLAQRAVRVALCGVLVAGACGSAWAWRSGILMPAAAQATGEPAKSVRIAGGVMAGQVVSRVNPVYPPDAKAAHIQGAVVLHAVISKVGAVEALTVVSGPPELQGAALDSVRQWTYKPYLLNGEPVDVETVITVNFQLAE